jgi:hypothetical protein
MAIATALQPSCGNNHTGMAGPAISRTQGNIYMSTYVKFVQVNSIIGSIKPILHDQQLHLNGFGTTRPFRFGYSEENVNK